LEDLSAVLASLGVDLSSDEGTLRSIYFELGHVIGRWSAEQDRIEGSMISGRLLSLGRTLDEVARTLAGGETGLRDVLDIELIVQLVDRMKLDPTVGSVDRAKELISSFQQAATRLAHACLVAAIDVKQEPGRPGRPRLDWYDDFTKLLLNLAKLGGVRADLRKDRITGARAGWLLDAALTLEDFLYPGMKSGTAETCGKRLERSLKRLRARERQNQPGG